MTSLARLHDPEVQYLDLHPQAKTRHTPACIRKDLIVHEVGLEVNSIPVAAKSASWSYPTTIEV